VISKLNGFNQCTPLCRCGSPTRAQVSRQRPSPSTPIQGKCALCGKKGMVHNLAEVQAARFARLANLKAAYRLGPPTCLQRAAMRGCTARPVRRQLRRARRRHTGSAPRAGPNFAEVQGWVHATRRARSGLGSASRPAYSSIRCVQSSEFKFAKNTRQAGWENPTSRSQRAPRLLPKQLTAAPEAARLNATRSHA